jgi:hypothetical protein
MPATKTHPHAIHFALVLWAVLQARSAVAEWVVNDRGDCVSEWTAASLLRGPTAMLNALPVPIRSAAGGVQVALDDPAQGGVKRKVLLTPTLATIGGAMGLIESGVWLGTGLVDTVTGGYFAIAPEPATELSVAPIRPMFAPGGGRPATDPCGRSPNVTAQSS